MKKLKKIDPIKFIQHLNWLDGSPLLDVIEPYRQHIFSEALFTFDPDGTPRYNFVLAGRAKKNWKSADLVLAALYRLLAWDSPLGSQCYILANDLGQANDDLELTKKLVKVNRLLDDELHIKKEVIERNDGEGFLQILPAQDVAGAHGKTFSFCGFDEIHNYRDHGLFEALAPDPHRPDALIWITSYASLYNHKGVPLHDFIEQGKAGKDERMYFSWYSADYCTDIEFAMKLTVEERANPSTLPAGYLEQQKNRLPVHRYRRLHLNLGGAPEGAYFNAEKIEAAVGQYKILPYQSGRHYRAFVDMSGGSSDDATLSIAHTEDGIITVDGVWTQGRRPPFDPRKAIDLFVNILKTYNLSKVVGDNYAGETFKKDFDSIGVFYEPCPLPKSALYEVFEVELNCGRVSIPDETILISQLQGLVMRGAKIDHPPSGHDDVANAVAGAVWLAKGKAMSIEDFKGGTFIESNISLGKRLHEGAQWENLDQGDIFVINENHDRRWDW